MGPNITVRIGTVVFAVTEFIFHHGRASVNISEKVQERRHVVGPGPML